MIVTPEREFPLVVGAEAAFRSIPWGLIAPHEKRARSNHGKSLEALARHGGLSVDEALAVIENMDIPRRRDVQARVLLMAHVSHYRDRQKLAFQPGAEADSIGQPTRISWVGLKL